MTWEETIKFIRTRPEYKELVRYAYLEEDLDLNVKRFTESAEFKETLKLISPYFSIGPGTRLLDIGSGNGISAVAWALEGVEVDAVEPDPSDTVGAGAIRKLRTDGGLARLHVHEGF